MTKPAMDREVREAQARLRTLGDRRLREAEARAEGTVYQEPAPAELIGRAYRQMHDALNQFAKDLAKGWNSL